MNIVQNTNVEHVRVGEVGTHMTHLVLCNIVDQQNRDGETVYLVRGEKMIATAVRDKKTKMLTSVTALGIDSDDKAGEDFFRQYVKFNKSV